MVTKEKLLAAVCALVAVFVLATVRAPRVEAVPDVPPEEEPRAYRTLAAPPRLALEPREGAPPRDPFRPHDPWQRAAPAPLALPPAAAWRRAVPGGVTPLPRSPGDRPLAPTPGGAR